MKNQKNTNPGNSFLQMWIHGKLSSQEMYDFIHSDNYKNLVKPTIIISQ